MMISTTIRRVFPFILAPRQGVFLSQIAPKARDRSLFPPFPWRPPQERLPRYSHSTTDPQSADHLTSLRDPSSFWGPHARKLVWETPYSAVLSCATPKGWAWFPDGRISATYNLVTRHVLEGRGGDAAVVWDSPVTGSKRVISYAELQEEVENFAKVLKSRGILEGDRVLVYMPMIPESVISLLATAHLGAVHTVVFGGFSPAECAKRIVSASPKIILTASCGIEGNKVIPYLPLVREAIDKSGWKSLETIVFQRNTLRAELLKSRKELDWGELVQSTRARARGPVPNSSAPGPGRVAIPGSPGTVEVGPAFPSSNPQYIIYTSGTTGRPKGITRSIGGHLVGLYYSMEHLFSIRRGDTIFTASDLGWVVGHSYILYGPLLVGATTILFEGKPVGTPDASAFWRIISEWGVNVLSTAPTALRAIRQADPTLSLRKGFNLRSLRAIFLAGERSEPSLVEYYQDAIFGHPRDTAGRVVDNWWSSESGSPITGILLGPAAAAGTMPAKTKPGSAGKPIPGWGLSVVNDDGEISPPSVPGSIVLRTPLAPTGFSELWDDKSGQMLHDSYLKRFEAKGGWLDTGDSGFIDEEGYVHVMSRTDDVINVAAHRFSTGAIEQAVLRHPGIAEGYVVGCPDELKGHVPLAVVVLKNPAPTLDDELSLLKETNEFVRKEIGPIATLGRVVPVDKVPRTRSGKTLRRVLRALVENAKTKKWGADVDFPATIEDSGVIPEVRERIEKSFGRT